MSEKEQELITEDADISGDEVEDSFHHGHKFNELKDASTETQVSKVSNVLKSARQKSKIWDVFTIVNRKHALANCNVCKMTLSYKGSTSNLRKHVLRKHPKCFDKYSLSFSKPKLKPSPSKRPKLSELTGIDSFIINVVGNKETDNAVEIVGHEVEPSELQEVDGNCGFGENQTPLSEKFNPKIISVSGTQNNSSSQTKYYQTPSKTSPSKITDRIEKMKSQRIMDLQLECLELKKYTMQMETLLLEQQLNLPRSIHTENLRGNNNVTRGTQTDVGGSNTKVFFVTDRNGSDREGSHHFFSLQQITD